MDQHYHAKDRNTGQWIDPNDSIHLAAYSSVASLVVHFEGYFRKANGEVIMFTETVSPTSDRAVTNKIVNYGAGFLLSMVAHLGTGNASRGQCYVRARVQRNTGTPATRLATLLAGYVTDEYGPSFPWGKIEGPLEGPGYITSTFGTQPAAGANYITTIAAGLRWRFLSVSATLQTDANAANREMIFTLDDQVSGEVYSCPSGENHTATLTRIYYWADVGAKQAGATSTLRVIPSPRLYALPGWVLTIAALNKQATDQISGIILHYEEWIEA